MDGNSVCEIHTYHDRGIKINAMHIFRLFRWPFRIPCQLSASLLFLINLKNVFIGWSSAHLLGNYVYGC